MSLVLMILAIPAALMLWRDLKSGRVYVAKSRYVQPDYDAPELFEEKQNSPVYYWIVMGVVAVCCLAAFVMAILLRFVPEDRLKFGESEFLFFLTIIPMFVHVVYLVNGLSGRTMSWIKNYGSVDKKW